MVQLPPNKNQPTNQKKKKKTNWIFYFKSPFFKLPLYKIELFQILEDDAVSSALNMPANLENLAMATGLEKVSFHSNPKERQCQRMLRLLHNCTHLTR